MRVVFAVLAFTTLLSLAPQDQITTATHTCEGHSNWETPACETTWAANVSAVFLGLATDVREEDVPIVLDGEAVHTLRLHVIFQVEESFVGVPEKVVTITSGGDLCGFPFTKGDKYLVYGRRLPNGEVYVSILSSTKMAREAVDDLKYLRDLPTAPHGATIHGHVLRYTVPVPDDPRRKLIRPGVPVVGQRVEIHGSNQNYEVVVDDHGDYSLAGLPPGRYTVSINAEGAIYAYPDGETNSRTVDVADKGCALTWFWIDPFFKN